MLAVSLVITDSHLNLVCIFYFYLFFFFCGGGGGLTHLLYYP